MKDARKKVLSVLKPCMAARRFRFRPANDMFVCREGDFTYQWQTRFLQGSRSVEVDPAIGIRSETVEGIFHQISTFAPQHHAGTSTIGNSLANLADVGLREYACPVATDDDVRSVADKLLVLFETKAIPYFEQYGSLKAIDHLLNDRPDQYTPHSAYGLPRETRGLIVAKLMERSNYAELVALHRDRLVKLNGGFYLSQFEALVVSLAELP